MPRLSTSLCMVSRPGTSPLLRNLTNLDECLRVDIFHKLMLIFCIKLVVTWVFRKIKIFMIMLNEFIDLMEVIKI